MKHPTLTLQAIKHADKSISADDILKINELGRTELTEDDLYIFNLRACDGLTDRVADRMSDTFLQQFADRINAKSIPLLKDHDWSADKQIGRVYKASVETDENGVKFVKATAYTLKSNTELVEKIEAGILKELSVSFDGLATCSICGEPMEKDWDGRGHCKNQHIAGETYEDKQCESILTECTDVYEVSIVAVPCQPNASIIKKLNHDSTGATERQADVSENKQSNPTNNGGKRAMKKSLLALLKLGARNKAAEQPDEQVTELVDILSDPDKADEELTEEEITAIVTENEDLKKKIEELNGKIDELQEELKACKADAEQQAAEAEAAAVESVLDTEIDKLAPITETVKKNMLRDIDRTSLKLNDGKVEGLDAAIETIKKDYEGLYGKQSGKQSKDAPQISEGRSETKTVVKKGFSYGEAKTSNINKEKQPVKTGFSIN